MSGKNKRSFRLSTGAQEFVGGAKVQTDAEPPRHAGRREVDPLPVRESHPQTAGRRKVDTTVAHGTMPHHTQQHTPAQHSTAEVKMPWQDLSAGRKSINFTFTPELYAMATWCKNNVPGGVSYLEILRMGCAMVCADMIKKHYKPEE